MIEVKTAENREEWDAFITSHEESNFLQSWDFYEFHTSRGKTIVRKLFLEKGTIIGAYAGVVETARRGTHLAIAGGPIIDWNNKKLVSAVFKDIREEAGKNHCVFARVRPQLELSDHSLKIMKDNGLERAPTFLSVEYAAILDLHLTEEEIKKNMHRRIRYAVNNARNKGFEVIRSQNPDDIDEFYRIEEATARRQGFVPFSKDYLKKQFTSFAKNDEATLYIAKYNGEILAENFMIFYGNEASYHYAVSTELGTKLSGSPILHMTAMEDARKKGITRYNLWGIVGENEKNHRFYGVSFFKRGFGGSEYRYTPAHDLVIDRPRYLLTRLIETVRKRLRHT